MWRQQGRWQQQQERQARGGGSARPPRGGRGRGRGRGGSRREDESPKASVAKPWQDYGLQIQIQRRDVLMAKAKKSKDAGDVEAYQEQRAVVERSEDAAMRTFFQAHPDQESYWLPILAMAAAHETHFCDMCEVQLASHQDLIRHEAEHEVCGLEGCHYTANPEHLEEHILNLHASGLYGRMCRVQTPSEVQKWRDERKKMWPTQTRTDMEAEKQLELQRRKDEREQRYRHEQSLIKSIVEERRRQLADRRAEIALSHEKAAPEPVQAEKGPTQRRPRKRKALKSDGDGPKAPDGRIRVKKTMAQTIESDEDSDGETCDGVPRFLGTKAERIPSTPDPDKSESPSISKAPHESEAAEPASTPGQTAYPVAPARLPVAILDPCDESDEPPSEEPISKTQDRVMEDPKALMPSPASIPPRRSGPPRISMPRINRPMNLAKLLFPKMARQNARPSTLLQHLLSQEILRERSELLQCVKFVCQRGFFENRGSPLAAQPADSSLVPTSEDQ